MARNRRRRSKGQNLNSTEIAEITNIKIENIYARYLTQLMINSFKWNNLPDTIDVRYLELTLLTHGYCVFAKDPVIGYTVSSCALGGAINHYNMPTVYHCNSINYHRTWNIDNSVLILGNELMTPAYDIISFFASSLEIAQRTIDVNINAQMTPYFMIGDEKLKLSLENVYKQIESGVPCINLNRSFDTEDITVLKTDAPFVADKIQLQKHNIWRECMTMLGIDNANMDKKERVQSAEIQSNLPQVLSSRDIWLVPRQRACKQINKMFGLNVSVDFRNDGLNTNLPDYLQINGGVNE